MYDRNKPLSRITQCQYYRIGCSWQGPQHELEKHEEGCSYPSKTGSEVLDAIQRREVSREEDTKVLRNVIKLLSYEKINFNGEFQILLHDLCCFFLLELISWYCARVIDTYTVRVKKKETRVWLKISQNW